MLQKNVLIYQQPPKLTHLVNSKQTAALYLSVMRCPTDSPRTIAIRKTYSYSITTSISAYLDDSEWHVRVKNSKRVSTRQKEKTLM